MICVTQEKSKERHRAAQRKYRQRQRAKTSETEQRFEVLQKQLKEMRMKEVRSTPSSRQRVCHVTCDNCPAHTVVQSSVVPGPEQSN